MIGFAFEMRFMMKWTMERRFRGLTMWFLHWDSSGVLFPENTSGKKRELDRWTLVRNCRKGDRKNDFGDITAENVDDR